MCPSTAPENPQDQLDQVEGGTGESVDDCVGHAYINDKQNYLNRLRRLEGQVRGIARMIEEDRYCMDILTQTSAINSGVRAIALNLLNDHLNHCVVDAARTGGTVAQEKIEEVSQAIARMAR